MLGAGRRVPACRLFAASTGAALRRNLLRLAVACTRTLKPRGTRRGLAARPARMSKSPCPCFVHKESPFVVSTSVDAVSATPRGEVEDLR